MEKSFSKILSISLVLIAVGALLWWITRNPVDQFSESVPGADNRGKGSLIEEIINIGAHFKLFSDKSSSSTENWPRFRGADYDNIYKGNIKLIDNFDNGKGEILWSHELGEGHAGAAIYDGKVYLLDYNEEDRADVLHCYDLKSGEELWRRWYKVAIKRNHGMSRTVPAVSEDYIVCIGPRCHTMCMNRETGDLLWSIDMEKEYETETPLWYTGQCPLIDNGVAILAPGGTSLLIAVDCKTGEKLWDLPNPDGWKMSHSSILPYTFKGEKMYLYCAIGGVIAVSPQGELLWKTPELDANVIAPSALGMPDGKIFITAGYGAGSMMLQLSKTGNDFAVEVLDQYKPKDGLACEQQTPIYWEGHLFGIIPKDGGANRNQLVCVNPADTRQIIWNSDKENRFGLGPYILADGKFYLLNDDGTLHIIKASTKGYQHMASKVVLEDGHDAWAPLALADGLMILRDADTMVCVDLKSLP